MAPAGSEKKAVVGLNGFGDIAEVAWHKPMARSGIQYVCYPSIAHESGEWHFVDRLIGSFEMNRGIRVGSGMRIEGPIGGIPAVIFKRVDDGFADAPHAGYCRESEVNGLHREFYRWRIIVSVISKVDREPPRSTVRLSRFCSVAETAPSIRRAPLSP